MIPFFFKITAFSAFLLFNYAKIATFEQSKTVLTILIAPKRLFLFEVEIHYNFNKFSYFL